MRHRLRWLETALFSAAVAALGVPACEPLEGCEYTATCPGESGGGASGGAPEGPDGDAGTPNDALGGRGAGNASGSAGDESVGGAAGSPSGGSSAGDANGGGSSGSDASGVESGAGGQGAAGAPPCAGGCAPPLAVCDTSADSCVECTGDEHCSGDKPACDSETRACVACVANSGCSGETPVCSAMTHACVQCLESKDCTSQAPLCDTGKSVCVECLNDPDCSTAASARCVAGQCEPCSQDDDCAHIPGKNVCNAGTCVQCTEAAASACGAHSCNPRLNRCTSTLLGSVGLCQKCLSDRECIAGNQADPDARCVPMTFQGTVRAEAFCLRRSAKTCTRPFAQMPDAVASLSGAAAEKYCGVDPLTTRCEAVLDLIDARTCPSGQASTCGCPRNADGACTAPGSGALCGTVAGVVNSCTYACGTVNDCPTGRTCSIDQPYCH